MDNLTNITDINTLISEIKSQAKTENSSKKVIVGMSGGVDSSVSAYIMQLLGYNVEGCFMKNWEEDDGTEYCTAKVDLEDAQAVADQLGIKLHKINFAAEYWDNVFEDFLREYNAGRTPNPDILCNREIKFKAFMDYALEDLEADYIATGHYCRTGKDSEGNATLLRGLDNNKDQSYFLYTLSQEVLEKVFFPVGNLNKPQVRMIADYLGLKTAKKKDSTGICFIGERRFDDFLANYMKSAKEGEIRNIDNEQVLGKHHGIMFYTIGQRKGLGIGGIKGHEDTGWYVAEKDLKNNVVYVVDNAKHPKLFGKGMIVKDYCSTNHEVFTYLDKATPNVDNLTCKIRYRAKDVPCSIKYLDNQTIEVIFSEPQSSIAPGQSVVFYYGERCLGGGIIDLKLN